MTIAFSLQFKLIRESAGSYDEQGRYQEGVKTESTINGSLQPVNDGELLNLPEGQRIKGAVKIYTDTELIVGDRIEVKGVLYEVHNVEDRTGLFLPHYKSIALKVPDNESLRRRD